MGDYNPYKKREHRKTWIAHYGPIPKEPDGRSYEIHHIDGNPENNNITNLIAVTLQEHYNIHYAQGDWGACFKMSEKLNLSPQEISDISRKTQLKRLAEGTHNWQDPAAQSYAGRKSAEKLFANGTHNFIKYKDNIDKSRQQRLIDGTHNLQGADSPSKKPWTCPHCNKSGKGVGNYTKYHGDNCKLVNPNSPARQINKDRAATWQITTPNNDVIIVKNINMWAKDHNISSQTLYRSRHGYKAIKL